MLIKMLMLEKFTLSDFSFRNIFICRLRSLLLFGKQFLYYSHMQQLAENNWFNDDIYELSVKETVIEHNISLQYKQ